VPPLLLGVIAKTKAFVAGRKGPPLMQLYYDLFKLWRKGFLMSRSATAVFRMAPLVIFVSLLAASLLLPLTGRAPIHFDGDLILFAYLLGLARFALMLGAWDCGSSFEGMGASREAAFGALSELAFFLGLVVSAIVVRSLSLSQILLQAGEGAFLHPAQILLFAAFFVLLLVENARIPFDDPNTHLELTMIHEVMILDSSGPHLGWMLYASSIKLFLFSMLAVSFVWPQGPLVLKIIGVGILIGVIESANARLRLIKVPQLLVANFVVMAFALLITLLGRGS